MRLNTHTHTENMKKTLATTLPYYSGNIALDCPPMEGAWDGNTFTDADGSKWTVDPSDSVPHPREDGTGTHYLLPAEA